MPPSEGYGATTFNMRVGRKVAQYGNQYVTQNQGADNLLIIHRVLNLLFVKNHTEVKPSHQIMKRLLQAN